MARQGDPSAPPALTRSDAVLLAACTESGGRGQPVDLRTLIHDLDWLDRSIPTFDEISYGIPRLVANGYVVVTSDERDQLQFTASPSARALRNSIKGDSLADVVIEMTRFVGAAPWPETEVGDRSLGRLSGLTTSDVDRAVRQHARWVEHLSKPLIAASRVLGCCLNRRGRSPVEEQPSLGRRRSDSCQKCSPCTLGMVPSQHRGAA
jgi:hypothetical protein